MLVSKKRVLRILMLIIVSVSVHAKTAGCVEGNCDTGSSVYHYEGQLSGQQCDGQWLVGQCTGAGTHHYTGDWLAGKRQGRVNVQADGHLYDGGKQSACGTYDFASGDRCVG